ncbi:MAG: tetratricopeptide repeat protein [Halopseudomonas aestusnigri]
MIKNVKYLLVALNIPVLLFCSVLLAGCVQVTGPYYLETGQYQEGINSLEQAYKENPNEPSSAYYLGRYYLRLEKPDKALPYLQKAVNLDPEDADYHFWLGVSYWGVDQFDQEQAEYKKTIALDQYYTSAHLYLGHGYLDKGKWDQALGEYDQVLKHEAYNPEALFNRAVALGELNKPKEEIAALKEYISSYPDGSLTLKATTALNARGDYTYRNHLIGNRNITLHSIDFRPDSNVLQDVSKESLQVIAAVMHRNKDLKLNIIAFHASDVTSAKARAHAIRRYIQVQEEGIASSRLPLSWFGQAEKVQTSINHVTLGESVMFVTAVQ